MKTAIGLVIFILILPFIVNIPDAQLSDDAQKLLNVQTAPLKPKTDNGFYALLGFEAPLGKDIYEAGTHACMAYSNSQDSEPPRFQFSLEEIIGPSPEMPDPNHIPKCNPEKQECLGYYSEKEEQLIHLLKENELLLQRYGSLNNYAFFQDITKPAPWAPQIGLERAIFAGHLLTVGKAAVLFTRGNHEKALQILVTDILLWRKLLAEATNLFGKTDAIRALRLNYSLMDEMLDRISTDEAAEMIQNEVLAPLSTKERSTNMVWDRHFRALAWSLSNNRWPFGSGRKDKIGFLERCFVKSNATLNDAYAMFHLLKRLLTVEPDKVENVREVFSKRLGEIAKFSPYKLYNPLGKTFVSSSFDDQAGIYWNRDIHSLDELISRTRVKVEN